LGNFRLENGPHDFNVDLDIYASKTWAGTSLLVLASDRDPVEGVDSWSEPDMGSAILVGGVPAERRAEWSAVEHSPSQGSFNPVG